MIHRFICSCLALLVWASPATAGLSFETFPETYQFTLKYFDAIPSLGLVDTSGDITLTFTATKGFYYSPNPVAIPGSPTDTGQFRIDRYQGAPLQVTAFANAAPGDPACSYLGPDVITTNFSNDVPHPCPFDGTSRPFQAYFTGDYQGYFLLEIVSADLSCGCGDAFGFKEQLYFPPANGDDGYFQTGTFNIDQFQNGTLTIALIDPTSPGGGGGTGDGPTGPDSTPVPEPAGWALMVGGLGLVGATRRRRSVPPRDVGQFPDCASS